MHNKIIHTIFYEQEHLIEIFGDISPFNMSRDIRLLKKQKILRKVLIELEASIQQEQYKVLQEEKIYSGIIRLVKVRILNPNNNKGKRSGLRCICIVTSVENVSCVLTIYAKDGGKQKNEITHEEQSAANKLFYNFVNGYREEGENDEQE